MKSTNKPKDPKPAKLNTLQKFEYVLDAAKKGKTNNKTYLDYLAVVRAALRPREKAGIIETILNLYVKEGYTKKEIINMGYNRSTVSRQIKEYDNGTYATNYRDGLEDDE